VSCEDGRRYGFIGRLILLIVLINENWFDVWRLMRWMVWIGHMIDYAHFHEFKRVGMGVGFGRG
jgi:hypothetical protein